jgi:hypothetical protein
MKYVSILNPEPMPFGDALLEASVRAMVAALFLKAREEGASTRS